MVMNRVPFLDQRESYWHRHDEPYALSGKIITLVRESDLYIRWKITREKSFLFFRLISPLKNIIY